MAYSQRRAAPLRVSPMLSADNVSWALRSGPRPTPEYVKAVIRSYLEIKVARGKQKWEIEPKLSLLEREFPQYPDEFQAVRAEFNLPPSRFFPSTQLDMLRRTQTSTSSRPTQNVSRTNTSNPRINRVTSAAASVPTRRPTTTTRPDTGDDDEPPPPPYARTDPEPEQTRMLEARLAAEAESAGTTTYDPPPTAPPSSSRRASQPASISQQPQTVYPTSPSSRRDETPQRIPSDPELRRIWEDSQFEEAKRLSIAAAREQKDLEEAMALSLAEAEGSAAGPSNRTGLTEDNGQRGASSYIPASSSTDYGGETGIAAGQNPAGGSSGISADLAGLDMSGDYEYRQHEENLRQERMEQERQQRQQQQDQNPFHQPSHIPANYQNTSLLDDNDDLPLAVPLTPMKTGAILQSKNPFLSPSDPEAELQSQHLTQASDAFGTPASSTPQPSGSFTTPSQQHLSPPQSPTSATRRVSSQSLRDSPGSAHTSFYLNDGTNTSPRAPKPLPPPPGPGGIQPGTFGSPRTPQFLDQSQSSTSSPQQPERYAPPPGPPPAHLRIPTAPTVIQQSSAGQQAGTPLNQYSNSPQMHTPDNQAINPSQYPSRAPTATQPPLPPRRDMVQSPQQGTQSGYFAEPGQNIMSPTHVDPGPSSQNGPPRLPIRPGLQNGEDPLELLKSYDTVFLIDDSASMAGERWEQAKTAITEVAEIAAEYDDDGIDVYFLNSKRVGKELKTNEDVEDLFAGLVPRGPTPTGARMEVILRDYMGRLERSAISPPASEQAGGPGEQVKPINLIIVTDGAPSNDPASVIVATAKRLDRGDYPVSQIGIQFFQIGNDTEARKALQELDDGLAETHGIRDMVDTVPYNGEGLSANLILKTLLGGINRRLDRR